MMGFRLSKHNGVWSWVTWSGRRLSQYLWVVSVFFPKSLLLSRPVNWYKSLLVFIDFQVVPGQNGHFKVPLDGTVKSQVARSYEFCFQRLPVSFSSSYEDF
ncbi:hypothetical protein PHJA_000964700 [Phtheirospermum japonicum]|uniref:Uncharacterized protein n=1 Tax=Phtheirospermum japonicum TaxID=374723 RepID=A0A830BKU4_9LAMI|nr:hypothetical protein PHJA_000964700 [Phtheirospermum japonicum]